MRFTVVTIFPEMFESVLAASLLGKAREAGLLTIDFVNPRDFTSDRHRSVDDAPYGGGPGMVMKVEPLVAAIESIARAGSAPGGEASGGTPYRVSLTPGGEPLTQPLVRTLAEHAHVLLLCGRYEGIDERVAELAIDREVSLGDFVMTGGELAAMAVIDAVARLIPGVLGSAESAEDESFSASLLEYPQYTRPAEFRGRAVPEVLASGNHERIRQWRRAQSLARTAARRPDLLARHPFSAEDEALFRDPLQGRVYVALAHHPVYDRERNVVTSSVTNFDIHDIARSSATYGVGGYFVVTPVTSQRDKVERILDVWRGAEREHREAALRLARTAASIEEVRAAVTEDAGAAPLVVATSASADRFGDVPLRSFAALRREALELPERPLLLLFGTGWGLTDEVVRGADRLLVPICGRPRFNHLAVRTAVGIILDRLLGLRDS